MPYYFSDNDLSKGTLVQTLGENENAGKSKQTKSENGKKIKLETEIEIDNHNPIDPSDSAMTINVASQ